MLESAGEKHEVLLHVTNFKGKCKRRILEGKVRLLARGFSSRVLLTVSLKSFQLYTQLQLGRGEEDAIQRSWSPSKVKSEIRLFTRKTYTMCLIKWELGEICHELRQTD